MVGLAERRDGVHEAGPPGQVDGGAGREGPAVDPSAVDPSASDPSAAERGVGEHGVVERDGRRIGVTTLARGGPGSRTIVFSGPAPGSGAFDPDPDATALRDVTLLGVDRPGYGASDPVDVSGWAGVDVAADDLAAVAVAIAEELGGGRVGVAGWSAGGRVALAFAARHPNLVGRVAVLGTPAPHEAIPWMADDEAAGLAALADLPAEQAHAVMMEQLGPLAALDPEGDEALELLAVGAADRTVLARSGVRERLTGMMRAAFAQGAVGLAQDLAGLARPWGFEPGDVQAKTLVLAGQHDPVAGPRHGRWWRAAVPRSRLEVVPGVGHLLVVEAWARVLRHLAPTRGREGLTVV